MSDRLETIKKYSYDDEGNHTGMPLALGDKDWLIGEVDRYETLIKVIHELAKEHLYEPSPDGKEIPAIHALTKEIMQ